MSIILVTLSGFFGGLGLATAYYIVGGLVKNFQSKEDKLDIVQVVKWILTLSPEDQIDTLKHIITKIYMHLDVELAGRLCRTLELAVIEMKRQEKERQAANGV
jgi:hypothetical protein